MNPRRRNGKNPRRPRIVGVRWRDEAAMTAGMTRDERGHYLDTRRMLKAMDLAMRTHNGKTQARKGAGKWGRGR